jgi:hypothetical protein
VVAREPHSIDLLDHEAVRSLERDGLVVVVDGVAQLPA